MSIKTTNAIMRQIEALEEACRTRRDGKLEVVFKDGSTRWIEPGEGIDLILHPDPDKEIADFRDTGHGNGKLAALLRGILEA